jgi:hypothetical protein
MMLLLKGNPSNVRIVALIGVNVSATKKIARGTVLAMFPALRAGCVELAPRRRLTNLK